jgi:hypothetical protein
MTHVAERLWVLADRARLLSALETSGFVETQQ